MRRVAWLGMALVAVSGCAASYRSEPVAPPALRPAVAQPAASLSQPGCQEPTHQPFPSDEGAMAHYPRLEPVQRVAPGYPVLAREKRVQGKVVMRALVCEHGRVVNAHPLESIPLLDDAAMEALSQWSFQPAVLDGRPVAAWTDVPFQFTLH